MRSLESCASVIRAPCFPGNRVDFLVMLIESSADYVDTLRLVVVTSLS